MNPTVKKALNITKTVCVWAILALAILMTVFTLLSSIFVDKNDRTLFGMRMMIVLTGSMRTEFPEGDIIFTVDVDPKDLKKGDIITFESDDVNMDKGRIVMVTHEIVKVNKDENGKLVSFTTAGTTTGKEDPDPVYPSQVVGKYIGKIPKLGYVFEFLKTTPGYVCCILIPFLLIIGYQGFNCVMLFRKYKSEQVSEMKEERAKLEEERAESQKMMQELLALKAQLEAKDKPQEPSAPAAEPPSESEPTQNASEESPSDSEQQ